MAIRYGLKRGLLRAVLEESKASGRTLLEQIEIECSARVGDVRNGQVLASSAVNGHAISFSIPGSGAASPGDIAAFWGEMLDLHDLVKARLIAAGTAAPTEDQIHAEMVYALQPVTSILNDFTALRYA